MNPSVYNKKMVYITLYTAPDRRKNSSYVDEVTTKIKDGDIFLLLSQRYVVVATTLILSGKMLHSFSTLTSTLMTVVRRIKRNIYF
jgi:hypothetical protein